jgi:hypothetical protein
VRTARAMFHMLGLIEQNLGARRQSTAARGFPHESWLTEPDHADYQPPGADSVHRRPLHYVLDEDRHAVAEPSFLAWAEWFDSTKDRIVDHTQIDSSVTVETVFLGLDLWPRRGPPHPFPDDDFRWAARRLAMETGHNPPSERRARRWPVPIRGRKRSCSGEEDAGATNSRD